MRTILCLTTLLVACGGCVQAPPPQPMISGLDSTVAPDNPDCREYTAQVTIGGQPQHIVGHACRQPDGSWQIVEGTPDQPGQVVTVYQPPPYPYPYPYTAYYPPYDPWFWGPSVGLGASFVFFGGHHHRGHGGSHHGGHGGHGGGHHGGGRGGV
jgi:hypothetical protein